MQTLIRTFLALPLLVGLLALGASQVSLPNGSTLQIKLLEHMADGRNKVQWSIDTPGKKGTQATMIASPSEPFFIGGPSHDGGTLVLVVQIGEGKKKK